MIRGRGVVLEYGPPGEGDDTSLLRPRNVPYVAGINKKAEKNENNTRSEYARQQKKIETTVAVPVKN